MSDMVEVSLNTDHEGFISQECPSCNRRFKAKYGEGSDQPVGYCPYCGHHETGCWWTPEQSEYLAATAAVEVLSPQMEKMAREFNRKTGGGGLISMSMNYSPPSTPQRPIEAEEEWPKVMFQCCGETIKHDGASQLLNCIICGAQSKGATDPSRPSA